VLRPKIAFYRPRRPRLELKIPTVKFPGFFQTKASSDFPKVSQETLITKLPSNAPGFLSGYNSAEMVNNMTKLDSGSQGFRMAASGILGFFTGGSSGVAEGIIGSMISSVSDPGQRNPLSDIKPRKTGEIWKEIFSGLPAQTQRWITDEPALPENNLATDKYFDDLISRTRTIAELRNEVDKRFRVFLGDSQQEKTITSAELDNSIKRIEDMRKNTEGNILGRGSALGTGVDTSLLSITPPIKSVDGWLYLENTETLPSIDRSIVKNYSYDKYLEAIA